MRLILYKNIPLFKTKHEYYSNTKEKLSQYNIFKGAVLYCLFKVTDSSQIDYNNFLSGYKIINNAVELRIRLVSPQE